MFCIQYIVFYAVQFQRVAEIGDSWDQVHFSEVYLFLPIIHILSYIHRKSRQKLLRLRQIILHDNPRLVTIFDKIVRSAQQTDRACILELVHDIFRQWFYSFIKI